jgi:hypothetical protein
MVVLPSCFTCKKYFKAVSGLYYQHGRPTIVSKLKDIKVLS